MQGVQTCVWYGTKDRLPPRDVLVVGHWLSGYMTMVKRVGDMRTRTDTVQDVWIYQDLKQTKTPPDKWMYIGTDDQLKNLS